MHVRFKGNSSRLHTDSRAETEWRVIKRGRLFYKKLPIASVDMNDLKLMYGISEQQIVIELFRINGGKVGFYLADLRHKQYYYCGLTIDQ